MTYLNQEYRYLSDIDKTFVTEFDSVSDRADSIREEIFQLEKEIHRKEEQLTVLERGEAACWSALEAAGLVD